MPTAIHSMNRTYSLLINPTVELEFLLPNGLILPLKLDSESSLLRVKEELWKVAAQEPLFEILKPKERYIFAGINRQTADEQDYYDQSLRVRELPLLLPYLRVVEVTGDSCSFEKNKQDALIASCIGISLADLDHAQSSNPEVKWARARLSQVARLHRDELLKTGIRGVTRYVNAAQQCEPSTWTRNLLADLSSITISAWVLDGEDTGKEQCIKLKLPTDSTVLDAITGLLNAQTELIRSKRNMDGTNFALLIDDPSAYVLKVCCSQAYLFDLDAKLTSYVYVQHCLEQRQCPCLSPILHKDVCNALMEMLDDYSDEGTMACLRRSTSSDSQHHLKDTTSTWLTDTRLTESIPSIPSDRRNHEPSSTFRDPFGRYPWENRSFDEPKQESSSTQSTVKSSVTSLWAVPGYLCVQVRSARFLSNLSAANPVSGTAPDPANVAALLEHTMSQYIVRVGLFHGSQSLIEFQTTHEMPGTHLSWSNKCLNFHVLLADIPPAARLCVSLIKVQQNSDKRSSGKMQEYPVGWANVNFFDHLGFMRQGDVILSLWPVSFAQSGATHFHNLYPTGTVLANPSPDFTLLIRILNPTNNPIRLPTFQSYIETHIKSNQTSSPLHPSRSIANLDLQDDHEDGADMLDIQSSLSMLCNFVADEIVLRDLVTRDPLYELSEQEKATVWRGRYFCLRQLPQALPWLTQSMCWYRRLTVMEFYYLLHLWPRPLAVPVALQLLGAMGLNNISGLTSASVALAQLVSTAARNSGGGASGVADPNVRELAVSSLYGLSDMELADYLLQLVQALKAEPYLDNHLCRFILSRALRNPITIGLPLFWHLRSEIHLPDIRLKFGILLEAFCIGCGPFLTFLAPQVTALNRLEAICVRVKELSNVDEQRVLFRQEVCRLEARQDLQFLASPLCLNERLGELIVDKCDVKNSKKRPLWLVWTNPDQLGVHHHSHYQLIFKHGDDLRQDMLILKLLRVMDRIWKSEGLDMHLIIYGCLATGPEMGLIEVVRNARTVRSILDERLAAALQIASTQLYKWLTTQRTHGPPITQGSPLYEEIIRNFTKSCAAYCVATFVLGIRDRHSDNIMVDTSGHLFHIDFGHILDNKKKKLGINRERVPFVLTEDFTIVIARGNSDEASSNSPNPPPQNVHMQEFIQLCCKAYLSLRKHANLLLTLFAMMLPCGLPELTSLYDLDYVKRSLALEMNEAQAVAYFMDNFNEARKKAWSTKIDWLAHWTRT